MGSALTSRGSAFGAWGFGSSVAGVESARRPETNRMASAVVAAAAKAPGSWAVLLDRFAVFDQHVDSPRKIRGLIVDSHRRQRGTGWSDAEASEPDEASRVILGRADRRGPVVGQVILAETELPPQPPVKRLVEQDQSGEGREVPRPGVAVLDVRPLVRQGVFQGLLVAACTQGRTAPGSPGKSK